MLSVNVEQCANVKFCVKIGKSITETYDLLKKVYGDECLSRTQVHPVHQGKRKHGRENTNLKQSLSAPPPLPLVRGIVHRGLGA